MSLTDDQVNAELRKMRAFIEKEAQEKAKEIRIKADEEYEIEKSSLVRAEMAAIDDVYGQRKKKAILARQITMSTIGNKSRLEVLSNKEEIIHLIFDDAVDELKKITKDEKENKRILTGLIEEAALILLEKEINLTVREADVTIAKEAASEAAKYFEEKAKYPISIEINDSHFLGKDSAGGVFVSDKSGKITLDNTLDERLKILSDEGIPAIRFELFGPSETRKFFD